MEEKGTQERRISFTLRVIHNQIKHIICRGAPNSERGPKTQLQGGILGYLYHHSEQPVYQRDLEKEFRISRATATNTLQVMEREGLIVRQALDKDARLKRIQLTEEARQHHKQIEFYMDMLENRMIKRMTEAEVAQLHRLLDILMENLEEFAEESQELFKEENTDRAMDGNGQLFQEENTDREEQMETDSCACKRTRTEKNG